MADAGFFIYGVCMKKVLVLWIGLILCAPAFAADYIVTLSKDSAIYANGSSISISDSTFTKTAMRESVYRRIQELNYGSTGLFAYLTGKTAIVPKYVYWSFNSFATDITDEQAAELRASGKVASVVKSGTRHLEYFKKSERRLEPKTAVATYGLVNTNVVSLRASNPNADGAGVVVGIIDTGIDATHPDLAGKVLKFKDFVGGKTEAYDDNGHGTHVAGTIAGGNSSGTAIGVAPNAKLIVAKVFSGEGSAKDTDILAAMQWMLDPDENPATNDSPAVVSNSWGGSQETTDMVKDPFYPAVEAWLKADIFPSFAAGNEGSQPNTMSSPGGLLNVIGVAAVDDKNAIASFSSRGPITWVVKGSTKKYVKPDISAPGVKVYSSLPNGKYAAYSGTSMATPHVSGIVALIRQANPSLNVKQVEKLLYQTANPLGLTQKDNAFGYGLIDAKASVEAAKQ